MTDFRLDAERFEEPPPTNAESQLLLEAQLRSSTYSSLVIPR